MTTYAYARQTKWISLKCEHCGTHYGCLVEATGQASDMVIPFSRETLQEGALLNLGGALQQQAAKFPCPQCYFYPSVHVARMRSIAGRISVWAFTFMLLILLTLIMAAVAPRAPFGLIFVVALISWIGARYMSRPVMDLFDPNRNLQQNQELVNSRFSRGVLRMEAPEKN